jgi:hypothetical protein
MRNKQRGICLDDIAGLEDSGRAMTTARSSPRDTRLHSDRAPIHQIAIKVAKVHPRGCFNATSMAHGVNACA